MEDLAGSASPAVVQILVRTLAPEDVTSRTGGGSRSPIKPNLDTNFAHYAKAQTFLGVPFILLKANNEDASNLGEWISMKLYRKLGLTGGIRQRYSKVDRFLPACKSLSSSPA